MAMVADVTINCTQNGGGGGDDARRGVSLCKQHWLAEEEVGKGG